MECGVKHSRVAFLAYELAFTVSASLICPVVTELACRSSVGREFCDAYTIYMLKRCGAKCLSATRKWIKFG